MKGKDIPAISAIKKSHHNQDFKSIKRQSMKVQSIHVMSALEIQDDKSNIILPFKDCFGETILPKGWNLNEAGEKPTLEDMVLLMHAEVEKDDSKDTFACNDDAHKAYMGPESHVLR